MTRRAELETMTREQRQQIAFGYLSSDMEYAGMSDGEIMEELQMLTDEELIDWMLLSNY